MLRFASGARSDVGLVRDNNEDSGFAGPYLQLVADGVGGAAAGEVASATTAYVVSALSADAASRDLRQLLTDAVRVAHEQLRAGVEADPGRTGMATTLTAALAHGDEVVMAHIGDSRGYRWREGRLEQLTTDHTVVQALIDEGQLTREQVPTHPYRSVVLRSVDADSDPVPDVFQADLRVGDRLMLCSDGLSDLVAEAEMGRALGLPDPQEAASALVDAALANGGRDNVTVLVADLEDGPVLHPDGRLLGALGDPYLVIDPGAVRHSDSI
ncbi:PP2C family protein-serine/threonine phosphatase [Nocardioides mesophilus]|uniref:Serine/threonine-protein phosphatase n=1 Tax=Nocardioides mesophilus TaxID=433659 RepID=A0A7G9RCY3_9ACTN|nr:protein phosphatase 2C domain-containing protein [Nocardioides mesophilus]QNN53458.1 serine/threonine-protein phosphatase [Nocardioides mesophilus]